MTPARLLHIIATSLICIVWFANGFFCKVLSLVPRHQEIVARILGGQYSWFFTKTIGVAEILMMAWILTRIKSRLCAVFQMFIVGIMNVIELILAPDLLLFGKMNIVFASFFIALIYIDEFGLVNRKYAKQIT
jgi:hypothetical protein